MKIEIKNIKKIEDLTVEIPDNARLIMACGANEVGKSTFGQALESIFLQNLQQDYITENKQSGYVIYSGKTISGEPITIKVQHDGNKSTFEAIIVRDNTVKTIRTKGDIRAMIGQYHRLSMDNVYRMVGTESGRVEFITKYVFGRLSNDERNKLMDMLTMISPKVENSIYNERKRIGAEIKELEGFLSNFKPSEIDDDIEHLQKVYNLVERLEKLRSIYLEVDDVIHSIENGTYEMLRMRYGVEDREIAKLFYTPNNEQVKQSIAAAGKQISDTIPEKYRNKRAIEIKELIDQQKAMEKLSDKYAEAKERLIRLKEKYQSYDKEIESIRNDIAAIMKRANLPEGLSIDENYNITLDGYPLEEKIMSESRTKLMILDLVCSTMPAGFVDIDNITSFDSESISKIIKIAAKYNAVVLCQKVTDDDNLTIKWIIE